jgi:hypothetical protein
LLNYPRHFVLLLAMAAGLAAASRLAAVLTPGLLGLGELLSAAGIASQFAIYGALHALAFVSSLTARPSLGRQIAFIAAAAAMSLATAWLTLVLVRRMSNLSGPVPIVIAAGALGAWAYAGTIHCMLRLSLGARSTTWMALACAAAVAAAYPCVKHFPSAAGLGLAVPWWLAFSGTVALQDARRALLQSNPPRSP